MTFSYNRNIPDGPNNPSVDQPKMKINTNSTDDIVAVDHVSFNLSNGGQHKSIHFNQDASYVPVPPVSPPELFTQPGIPNPGAGSIPQIFFYSGNAAQSANQYSNAANFSTFLLGGLILKGGSVVGAGGPSQIVTYSTLVPALAPFPNATLAVYLTKKVTVANTSPPTVTAVSSTTFTMSSLAPTDQVYFLAIGY